MSFITDSVEELELKNSIIENLDSVRLKLQSISYSVNEFNNNSIKLTTTEVEILNEEIKEIKRLVNTTSYNVLANSIMNPTKISEETLLSKKVSNLMEEANKVLKEDK